MDAELEHVAERYVVGLKQVLLHNAQADKVNEAVMTARRGDRYGAINKLEELLKLDLERSIRVQVEQLILELREEP